METNKEIISRPIPGITGKIIISVISIVAVGIIFLFRLEGLAQRAYDLSKENNTLIKEIILERKELVKINDARLNQMQLEHREFDFRLKQLEKFVEGYNSATVKFK